jgi:hypothetical protein
MALSLASTISSVFAPASIAALSSLIPHLSAFSGSVRSYGSTGRVASFSLPPDLVNTGNLGTLGCSPRFFRKWMEFQFETSGRGFTWYNRGMEWDFARFDVGFDECGAKDENATGIYETMHWSNFYPEAKGEWVDSYDFSNRSRILRRFMALHVFADVRGSALYDGTSVVYDRDSWLQRSIMS